MQQSEIQSLIGDNQPEGSNVRLRMFEYAGITAYQSSEWRTDDFPNTDPTGMQRLANQITTRAEVMRIAIPELKEAKIKLDDDAEDLTFTLGDLRVAVLEITASEPGVRRKNNVEFVEELMTDSPAGVLVEALILQAIETHALHVVSSAPKHLQRTPRGIFSGKAWVAAAEHIVKKFEERADS